MKPTEEKTTDAPNPIYRSRWGRFSPAMGWKSFFSEIIIVVLGVMIALAANEAVENWNWQIKVRDGEVRLRDDVERVFINAAELYVTAPCVDSQLSDLTDNLMKSGDSLRPMPTYSEKIVGNYVVRYPDRPYSFAVWQSLLADGTVAHISKARQPYYSKINNTILRFQSENSKNQQALGRLAVMAFPISLDPGVRKDLLVEIQEQQSRYQSLSLYALREMVRIGELNIQPNAEAVDASLKESGTVQFCKEHGKPLADWRTYNAP